MAAGMRGEFFAKFQFFEFRRKAAAKFSEEHQIYGLRQIGRSWSVIFTEPVFRNLGRHGRVDDGWDRRLYAPAGCYIATKVSAGQEHWAPNQGI